MFGLLLPLLVLAVAFGIDVAGWYRDALHLQGVADRIAASAGPLWQGGDRAGALQLTRALAVDVDIERAGVAGRGRPDGFEIVVSCRRRHLLAGLSASGRQSARAVAVGAQLVE